ncbi:creatininase family protein [Bremerella cremea]|uniref:Creatininase n=1 Tax=Blastopirellula marina TaxID=124 RepID=A0A2S8FL53_9BACT|nr:MULTISPECIES: creatininase family protein [Pirellulaceae]PQO32644.1 creatininase [Blastopirellula marina]RCS45711.1 creatininase family protein [Bremerella cremea]
MPAPRPWKLSEVSYGHVKQSQYEVAVLPLGATEPHNLHLPYGTDDYEGTQIGEKICEAAHAQGAKVILLPTVPYGTETNMREFPLAMNLDPSTLYAVVTDLIASLVQSGIKKVVLLNSHGGNEMKPLLRELYGKTEAQVFLCNWFKAFTNEEYFSIFKHMEDHAGEMETSMILAYRPELVAKRPDGSLDADSGATRPMQFEALEKGWVSITRPWHLLTTNSGSGHPHEASAEKGEQLMQLLVNRLAPFLVQLSDAKLDDAFPFILDDPS